MESNEKAYCTPMSNEMVAWQGGAATASEETLEDIGMRFLVMQVGEAAHAVHKVMKSLEGRKLNEMAREEVIKHNQRVLEAKFALAVWSDKFHNFSTDTAKNFLDQAGPSHPNISRELVEDAEHIAIRTRMMVDTKYQEFSLELLKTIGVEPPKNDLLGALMTLLGIPPHEHCEDCGRCDLPSNPHRSGCSKETSQVL